MREVKTQQSSPSIEDHNPTPVAGPTLRLDQFAAAIFDLDGVITQTARVHAAAWKAMFDDYLANYTANGRADTRPFDIDTDYRTYVDGKPRYDGVRSFLTSRNIDLPYGSPDDGPEQQTICGLGNRKNRRLLEKLRRDGVKAYTTSLQLIRRLRQAGLKTAVVSSSRNCRAVLEAAGISGLFDARVDGVERERLKLTGKPAPDIFLEASRRLGCDPQRCVGFEDASAGVQALRAAGYGCVIGVNRGDSPAQSQALREQGADRVVADLGELHLVTASDEPGTTRQLPSALDKLDAILAGQRRTPALFLDYDGTLTPIVPHPDDARLSEAMRASLQRLTGLCPVAIISGRDLSDVRQRVGIAGIWYAGSHGFDIAGPAGERHEYPQGRDYLPALDAAEQALRNRLGELPGCLVERKRFSIAIHYRQLAEDRLPTVKQAVDEIHKAHPELRLGSGKKLFELQPDLDWDKGKALRWLMQALDLTSSHALPVYIGDDVTDEDAFRELAEDGVGILVAETEQATQARYRLHDPDQVEQFLNRLGERLADHA